MASLTEARTVISWLDAARVDRERIRFAAAIAIFAAAVGAATILVNFLGRPIYPAIPVRLPLTQALYFGSIGALTSVIIAGPLAWTLYGVMPTFRVTRNRAPRRLRTWLGLGLGYSMAHVLLLSGLFMPMGNLWFRFVHSQIDVIQLFNGAVSNLMTAPIFALTSSVEFLFTGFIAAVVFGVGASLIDKKNASEDPATARYGAWGMSLALSVAIISFVAFAPEEMVAGLAKLTG